MRVEPTGHAGEITLPPTGVVGRGATTRGPATGAPPAPTGRAYVRIVLVLGALIALGPLSIDMYLPALPGLAADLGASEAAAQFTLTGMLAGLATGQLVLGPVSDALGRRRPLLAGVAIHALASVLCLLAPQIAVLSVTRVIQGFAGAAVAVSAMAIVRDLFSGIAAARMLSRLMLVMGAAPVLAPSLGGLILTWTSWRGIFAALAVAAAGLVAVAYFGLPETLPPHRRRSLRPRATVATYAGLIRDLPFVALVLIGGLMMSTMFAYVSGSPFVLQGIYGLSERSFALVFGANAVGIVVATQLNPVLLRRFHPRQVLTAAIVLATTAAGVLLVLVTAGTALPGVLVPLAAIIASCGLALPNTPALALTRHGEAAGTAAAVLGAVQFGVGAAIAPLVGLLGSGSAVPMAALMLAAPSIALVLALGVVRRAIPAT